MVVGATNGDRIDLSAIDAVFGGVSDPFEWRGSNVFDDAGQVRVVHQGNKTYLEINVTGADPTEAWIEFTGTTMLQEGYFFFDRPQNPSRGLTPALHAAFMQSMQRRFAKDLRPGPEYALLL